MAISETVIAAAVARYDRERERDRYIKLAARVADICRSNIVERHAVRAQITSRTKTVKSFEGKLRRFSKRPDKSFETVDSIFESVGDFARVRVATYRPEDEGRVADAIRSLFAGAEGAEVEVDLKDKLDPANCKFYRATHCQVFLRADELIGDYGIRSNISRPGDASRSFRGSVNAFRWSSAPAQSSNYQRPFSSSARQSTR